MLSSRASSCLRHWIYSALSLELFEICSVELICWKEGSLNGMLESLLLSDILVDETVSVIAMDPI